LTQKRFWIPNAGSASYTSKARLRSSADFWSRSVGAQGFWRGPSQGSDPQC